MKVKSKLITLQDIVGEEYFFNVPIYQRLYVWNKTQIETLLSDMWEACKDDKDVFYLGGTLVIERGSCQFDLIDGQQRFTTLWLISLVWQQHLESFRYEATESSPRHRINFAIRPQIKKFFEAQIAGTETSLPEARQLEDALAIIGNFVNDKKQDGDAVDIVGFTKFIFEKVNLVFTEVPNSTDLNKLFEVINNRGVQLQHHEILKARLLGRLKDAKQRECYGRMWDACSHMEDYVEKNLKTSTGLKLAQLFENEFSRLNQEQLSSAPSVLSALGELLGGKDEKTLSLSNILETKIQVEEDSIPVDVEGYEADRVRSIITFSMLLQHVLRIWLVREKKDDIARILDKDLIDIFEKSWLNEGFCEEGVKSFIELLWELRYRFDKHVVKWVEDGDDEIHAIRQLRKNESSLVRESRDSQTGFALLQSMLYHSQQMTTQYWLTPLLKFLLDNSHSDAFLYLKYLDNQLFCTGSDSPLLERTKRHLVGDTYVEHGTTRCNVLNNSLGVDFPHYWFYKLEFVLWAQRRDNIENGGEDWTDFRITARNSVEHISPQDPKETDTNKVSKSALNSFGNLALVSRSLNSEYSNLPFNEKRQRFKNRKKIRTDSLKMDLIYANKNWNDELAGEHQTKMVEQLKTYFNTVQTEVSGNLESRSE